MKIQPLLQSIDPNQFINQYLTKCGVKDVDEYLDADLSICDSPWDYPNMMIGVERLEKAIKENQRIGIIADADFDGYSSASVIYRFIRRFITSPITVFQHTGKGHGIVSNKEENLVKDVLEAEIDLLICPDAATNDVDQCGQLKDEGVDVLILDHHESTKPNPYAIIINHHLGNNLNTFLSGCGVTFKFCQACAEEWSIDLGDDYYDLVAASLATDSCSMLTSENYALTKYGFTHLTNPMLIRMYEEFNTRGNCPEGVSWGLGPKINAVIRGGSMEDKIAIFNAFVGEGDIDEAIEIAKRCHKLQTSTTTKLTRELSKEMDYDHKVLVGFSDAENKNYSGLVANKFTGQYGKPTLILRPINSYTWSGSLRSPVDIADKINNTGLATCQGHLAACGISVRKSNLDKLINWFDQSNLDMNPCKNVVAEVEPKDITVNLCKVCAENSLMWGQDIPKPLFYMCLETTPDKVIVFAKKTKTVKLAYPNGVEVMKFRAKGEDVDMLTSQKCKVECIVTLAPNEYMGKTTPQAKVEEWEITPIENNIEEDWEDLF